MQSERGGTRMCQLNVLSGLEGSKEKDTPAKQRL